MALRDSASLNLVDCFKLALEKIQSIGDEDGEKFLSLTDIDELLKESDDIVDRCPREAIFGYPTRPLYRELGSMLQLWFDSGKCPIDDLPTYNLLDEKDYVNNRAEIIAELSPRLKSLKDLYSCWSDDEIIYTLIFILKRLGKRGLLDLLGMRKTVGTSDVWPPPRRTLEATFETRHSQETSSVLTVGARALTKHSHRDHSASWWGTCTGSEQAKNAYARQTMSKILDAATWINIHELPHDVLIIEARQENGYGIRWTADGLQFRGFLEPQMIDGHEVGWRH